MGIGGPEVRMLGGSIIDYAADSKVENEGSMKKGYWVVAYRSISDASAVKAYGGLARAVTTAGRRTRPRKRHEFPDAHGWLSDHPFYAVRCPIVPACSVQLRHRHQVMGQVLRQPRPSQPPFPVLGRDVRNT